METKGKPNRRSLKYFHDRYTIHKEAEIQETQKRKREAINHIYDSYANDYEDPYYIYDIMMDAIDDGLTQVPIFFEEEDAGIALWDNDIMDLFTKGLGHTHPPLQSILEEQLTDEFRFVVDKKKVEDKRDNTSFRTIEVSLCWEAKDDSVKKKMKK